MNLDFAFIADAAQISSDGKLSVLGGCIDRVFSEQAPVALPGMVLVTRFTARPGETFAKHRLTLNVVDDEGGEVAKTQVVEFTPSRATDPTRPSGGYVLIGLAGLTFPRFDDYLVRLDLDGQEIAKLPLLIEQRGISSESLTPTAD